MQIMLGNVCILQITDTQKLSHPWTDFVFIQGYLFLTRVKTSKPKETAYDFEEN